MSKSKAVSMRECFADVPDPRREHLRLHNLWEIIAITILAVVSGADSWVEVAKYGVSKLAFLRTFLELPNGIPSHDTFGRVFALVSPMALQAGFVKWVQAIAETTLGRVVAIDGKTARRSERWVPACSAAAAASSGQRYSICECALLGHEPSPIVH